MIIYDVVTTGAGAGYKVQLLLSNGKSYHLSPTTLTALAAAVPPIPHAGVVDESFHNTFEHVEP